MGQHHVFNRSPSEQIYQATKRNTAVLHIAFDVGDFVDYWKIAACTYGRNRNRLSRVSV